MKYEEKNVFGSVGNVHEFFPKGFCGGSRECIGICS